MNIFETAAKLTLDSSGYDDGMRNAEKSGKGFADKLGKWLDSGAKKMDVLTIAAGQLVSKGIEKLGQSIVNLGKSAIAVYANYEQLVGGVETLFKDAAPIVQSLADKAYKTAGLSANEYMDTVTSFAGSLLQSLGGDTVKAAEYADMAISDMSDNANKMGTDMASIQAAYRGFSKQNYTIELMSAA